MLTPFERNLEVWRQLWRTLERSDLIVQIVDARNPLGFRSEDLAKYVLELNDVKGDDDLGEGTSKPERKNLLLINKSDLLTRKQRCVLNLFWHAFWSSVADVRSFAVRVGLITSRRTAFSMPSSPPRTASLCRRSAHVKKSWLLSRKPLMRATVRRISRA